MGAATKTAPVEVQLDEGQDQKTRQETRSTMKTTAPILASAADNQELAASRQSSLYPCTDESCAYFHHGHYADRQDPLFLHVFVGVAEPEFRVAIERLSTQDRWELSINVLKEDLTPEQARKFSRALVKCSEITESLNAERCA